MIFLPNSIPTGIIKTTKPQRRLLVSEILNFRNNHLFNNVQWREYNSIQCADYIYIFQIGNGIRVLNQRKAPKTWESNPEDNKPTLKSQVSQRTN